MLDECLCVPTFKRIGLFNMVQIFLEFLVNIARSPTGPQEVYNVYGETSAPAETVRYLAGYRGVGGLVAGGLRIRIK